MLPVSHGPATGNGVAPPALPLTWLARWESSCVIASVVTLPPLLEASMGMSLMSAKPGAASPIRIVAPSSIDFMAGCLLLRNSPAADDIRRTAGKMTLVSCPPAIVDAILDELIEGGADRSAERKPDRLVAAAAEFQLHHGYREDLGDVAAGLQRGY